jgi:hypothetical protein
MKKIILATFLLSVFFAPKALAMQEWVDGGYRYSDYSGDTCGNSPFTCFVSEDYVEGKYNQDMSQYYTLQNEGNYEVLRQISQPVRAGQIIDGRLYCYFGYVENQTAKRCDQIMVPENGMLDRRGKGWVCQFGFKKVYGEDTCELDTVPPTAKIKLDILGDEWDCTFGFKKAFGDCERLIFPPNSHADAEAKDGWDCNKGYKRTEDGDFCEQIQVPANAKLSASGKSWVCNTGYVVQYLPNDEKTCVKPTALKSIVKAVAGVKKLSCKFGYEDSGGECTKILIPLNGQLATDGKSWVCKTGYRKVNNQCVK